MRPPTEAAPRIRENPFRNLKLHDLPWQTGTKVSERRCSVALQSPSFKGVLEASHDTVHDIEIYTFKILNDTEHTVLEATVTLLPDAMNTVSRSIAKQPDSSIDGRAFSACLRDFIQELANQKQKSLYDQVDRADTEVFGRKPLDPETWNRIIGPTLTAYGYTEESDGHWFKQYRPTTKSEG